MTQGSLEQSIEKEFTELNVLVARYLRDINQPFLNYAISVNADSEVPGMINYTLWITPLQDHYKRHDFVATSFAELKEKFIKFRDAVDYKVQAVDYHQYEISRNEERIKHHKQEIENILNNVYDKYNEKPKTKSKKGKKNDTK